MTLFVEVVLYFCSLSLKNKNYAPCSTLDAKGLLNRALHLKNNLWVLSKLNTTYKFVSVEEHNVQIFNFWGYLRIIVV